MGFPLAGDLYSLSGWFVANSQTAISPAWFPTNGSGFTRNGFD